jgi:hypothetical protein
MTIARLESESFTSTRNIVNAPEWEVGDSWTYLIEVYNGDAEGNQLYAFTDDITFTVVDDAGDIYVLEGTCDSPSLVGDFQGVEIRSTHFTSIDVEVDLRKSDLGIEKWNQCIKGICLLILSGMPLPVQLEFVYTSTASPTWFFIPFPLFDGKNGFLDNTEYSEEVNIWFFWRLLSVESSTNSWQTGEPSYAVSEEQITVEAGTYTTYFVNAEHSEDDKFLDYYRTYYAEEVVNVVKGLVNIDWESTGETAMSFNLELKSTTYQH